ncbi:MAG: hypothetical protein ACJ0GX_01735 [Parasynechococcus sp.]|uniref:hypothetical protein n=1 Tax=Parasynechococcus sp. TaxID=3101203 RepID=UPI0038852DE9
MEGPLLLPGLLPAGFCTHRVIRFGQFGHGSNALLCPCSQNPVLQYPPPAAFTVNFANSSINYKLLFWVRNPLEAFAVGSDLRQAIWNAFDENGIGIPFPQWQVYPMEWPPSKEQSLRLGDARHQLQSEAKGGTKSIQQIKNS